MANEGNLKMFGSGARSESEERKLQAKGGVNSGAARRRKKTMKQSLEALMNAKLPKSAAQELKRSGVVEDDATYQDAVLWSMMQEALRGNVKAAEFVRETLGEDPKQKMQKEEMKQRKAEFEYKKSQGLSLDDEESEPADAVVLYVPDNGLGNTENKERDG